MWGNQTTQPWKDLAQHYGSRYGVDPRVIGTLISIESSGMPNATSDRGAIGLMQVISSDSTPPATTDHRFATRPPADVLLDPDTNVQWATDIIARALRDADHRLDAALHTWYADSRVDIDTDDADRYVQLFRQRWHQLWGTQAPKITLPQQQIIYAEPTAEPAAKPAARPVNEHPNEQPQYQTQLYLNLKLTITPQEESNDQTTRNP